MNSFKALLLCAAGILVSVCSGCDRNNVVDNNVAMPSRNWSYVNKVKVLIDITDVSKPYNIYFKLRHTADYRYSNIFVLFHLKGAGLKKQTRRYEYRLAEPDGKWTGSGSGNLYTYTFSLLTGYRFPVPGKYELELEQNMRDNPLREVSDAGIKVSKQGE